MVDLRCGNPQCGTALVGDEAFCGQCGSPTELTPATLYPASDGTSFFGHATARAPEPLNNATRYLCAAAYLDDTFANRVIRELVATRRAVAPSLNVDIGPVIRHCLRARRILLIRNVAVVSILALGFALAWQVTTAFLGSAVLVGWLMPMANVLWKKRRAAYNLQSIAYSVYILSVTSLTVLLLFFPFFSFLFRPPSSGGGSSAKPPHSAGIIGLQQAGIFLLLVAATWIAEFAYRFYTFRILIGQLKLGALPPGHASGRSEDRISVVEGAQWGNIALHATENPFMGTGLEVDGEREWSIAIRLDPADPARQVLRARPAQGEWVPVDPIELHQAIREKLASLNDPSLPVNERIGSLTVTDRLVGSGLLRWDSPLVDKELLTPYSHASPRAIMEIIRHPQARLRYYQHVVVNDDGAAVTSGGQPILDAADQGISVSAFIYAAVEARHFYLQFILTALPPIKADYLVIDVLPSLKSGKLRKMTLGTSFRRLFRSAIGALPAVAWALLLWTREKMIERAAMSADDLALGQLGAEVSVRELGMADRFGSHIHQLDVQKYTRIIERAVLETVQDFLAGKGVDVSAFSDSALTVINGTVIGSVSGGTNQVGGGDTTFNL
jgi:hypothetical protein